jgi:hypothetical protein
MQWPSQVIRSPVPLSANCPLPCNKWTDGIRSPGWDGSDDRPPQGWGCKRGRISRPAGCPYRPTSLGLACGRGSLNWTEDLVGAPHPSQLCLTVRAPPPPTAPWHGVSWCPDWSTASALHTTSPHMLWHIIQGHHCTCLRPLYLAQPVSPNYQ